jgi:hypothetical protein
VLPPERVYAAVKEAGFAVVDAAGCAALCDGVDVGRVAWRDSWDRLAPDLWLKDGGRYRKRRHGSFVVDVEGAVPVAAVAHRAHFQSVDYNALHGGLSRWFEPLEDAVVNDRTFVALVNGLARACDAVAGAATRWFVEVHQFRIDTSDGIGRPTPEGAHRDGVDFVAICFVGKHGIKGGETRVFDAFGTAGTRFTLDEPGSVLFVDDARVIHESTPIQPLAPSAPGHRDTLVITFRRGGFQAPAAEPRS